MPEVSEKQEKLWQDVVCFCCDSASRMKKNVHNDLKWTKPESSLFVFQKLCHFLDSIIKEGLKCSKPTLNVVDFAMLPGALSKYARALQAESSEKGQIPLCLALFAQIYFSGVACPLRYFPSTYLFGWCYLRCSPWLNPKGIYHLCNREAMKAGAPRSENYYRPLSPGGISAPVL